VSKTLTVKNALLLILIFFAKNAKQLYG